MKTAFLVISAQIQIQFEMKKIQKGSIFCLAKFMKERLMFAISQILNVYASITFLGILSP